MRGNVTALEGLRDRGTQEWKHAAHILQAPAPRTLHMRESFETCVVGP